MNELEELNLSRAAEDVYFSEMGKIPVMTTEQEIEAFRKLERSEEDIIRHLVALPWFAYPLLDILKGAIAKSKSPLRLDDRFYTMPGDHVPVIRRVVRSSGPGREWFSSVIGTGLDSAVMTKKMNSDEYSVWRTKLIHLVNVQSKLKSHCITSNLRLSIITAKKYARYTNGIALNDLIQEGNDGLISAVDRFDVERGYKFATYALWWVKAGIKRAIQEKTAVVRVPVHLMEKIRKVQKAEATFVSRHGREATDDELVLDGLILKAHLEQVLEYRSKYAMAIESSVFEYEGCEYSVIESAHDDSIPPDELMSMKQTSRDISRMFTALTPQESQILRWRFGFDDQDPFTLAEVGERLSLSRERIRQIEARALEKLRERGEIREFK